MVYCETCVQLISELKDDGKIIDGLVGAAYVEIGLKNFTKENLTSLFRNNEITVFQANLTIEQIEKSEKYKKIFEELNFPLKTKREKFFSFVDNHVLKQRRSDTVRIGKLDFDGDDYGNFYSYVKITGYTNPKFDDIFIFDVIVFQRKYISL